VCLASQRLCFWFSRHFVERPIGRIAAPKRRGCYTVERLIAEHGADAKLPDLLVTLADCEKARSISIFDRCRARYERYYKWRTIDLWLDGTAAHPLHGVMRCPPP
jgi:hypothetical protein